MRQALPESSSSNAPPDDIAQLQLQFRALLSDAEILQRTENQRLLPDVYLCAPFVLCVLPPPNGGAIIGFFGHPLPFLVKHKKSLELFENFLELNGRATLLTSDPFLTMQYEYQTGVVLPYIRQHASYFSTDLQWNPTRKEDVLVVDRPHESVLLCVIQEFVDGYTTSENTLDQDRTTSITSPDSREQRYAGKKQLVEGRLRRAHNFDAYPLQFVTRQLTDTRSYKEFSEFRCVVLMPYDHDLITFYEFYQMASPLFMPQHLSKYIYGQHHREYDHSWLSERERARLQYWKSAHLSPFAEDDPRAVVEILRHVV